jgi:hypothetical protein
VFGEVAGALCITSRMLVGLIEYACRVADCLYTGEALCMLLLTRQLAVDR